MAFQWLSVRVQYLQWISTWDTAVLHKAIGFMYSKYFRVIFLQITHKNSPYLTQKNELWVIFYELKI